jgi:hypothetical protein
VLVLVGVVNVPIIYFSVNWWNTLHQGASVKVAGGSTMAATMLQAMLIMTLAAWCYCIATALHRVRSIILEREGQSHWVGRLMGLYANQEVTSRQALTLIEWVLTEIPWLVTVGGNHDTWNTQKGDVSEVIHRLQKLPGLYENVGARMRVVLPSGAEFTMNVRHDFPGGSQFNPAHALVRQTLFDHRDHILACGHRHTSGYIPIWHNDPARLCHGFRVGTYKDFDHYAKEKGFKESNWARSMAAVIDPDFADDPVRYIKPFFSLNHCPCPCLFLHDLS